LEHSKNANLFQASFELNNRIFEEKEKSANAKATAESYQNLIKAQNECMANMKEIQAAQTTYEMNKKLYEEQEKTENLK
jgi:hypothetical protein